MQQPIRAILASTSISLLLGACASTKEAVLPQDGPTMAAIYAAHMGELGAEEPNAIRGSLGGRPIRSGYATAFPLYERVEYALPGEVATPR